MRSPLAGPSSLSEDPLGGPLAGGTPSLADTDAASAALAINYAMQDIVRPALYGKLPAAVSAFENGVAALEQTGTAPIALRTGPADYVRQRRGSPRAL